MIEKKNQRLYGLIGYPLVHSFSHSYFNKKFEDEHIDARYENFEIARIEEIEGILLRNPSLSGFNVTIPYKEKIIDYLDEIEPEAKKIGAVNVVKVYRQPDGSVTLKGYNSDSPAFTKTLTPLIEGESGLRALVLGSGGASKAVAYSLNKMGIEPTIVSRSAKEGVLTYSELTPEEVTSHKIIVNTTPLGMYPHVDECPPIPYESITKSHICYDLLYNPDITLFMKKSEEQGAKVKNGLEMLLLQAFMSWGIWTK